MFIEIEKKMDITNELLTKIEKHLKSLTLPPDMVAWAKIKLKEMPK